MSEPDEGERFKELWAWADQYDDEEAIPPVSPASVKAILVACDAEEWLSDALKALVDSALRPGRIVAVDVGSRDGTTLLLAEARQLGVIDEVVSVSRMPFGEAVAAALDGTEDWLWLLHDDCVPRPTALTEITRAAATADVVFPKLLHPKRRNYPDIIAECGQSISRTGFRVGAAEEGEVDQRQIEPGAVLGGSTAGMFVRASTWCELGGLAPEVPNHRAGVDFGWRANVAGHRVVTAPLAAIAHSAASRTFQRVGPEHPHRDDRLGALRIVAARGTSRLALRLSSWFRAFGYLLARSPSFAGAELRAHREFRATPEKTRSLASRIPAGEASAADDLLAPKLWAIKHGFDRLGSSFMDRWREFSTDTSLDDLTSDEYQSVASQKRARFAPHAIVVALFAVVGILAGWRFWGTAPVAGGGLLPAPSGFDDIWQSYLASGMPALGIGAVVSFFTFGYLQLIPLLLVLLGPALAAATANSALRAAGLAPKTSAVGAAVWAGAVLTLGLPSAGDVSGLVFAVVAPLLAKAGYAMLTDDATGAEGLRRPAVGAFWLFVLAAFWPPALLIATVVALILVLACGRPRARWAMLVAPVWVLFLPWLGALLSNPARLLTGVDPFAWPAIPPASYALFAGRIFRAGIPIWVNISFFGLLGIVVLWCLMRIVGARSRWMFTLALGLPPLIGVAVSRFALPLGDGEVRALLSPWLLLAVASAVAAMVVERRQNERSWPIPLGLAAVAALTPVLAWPFFGLTGPVQAKHPELPGYVTSVLESPRLSRALLVEKTRGRLAWNVVDAQDPQWGSGELRPQYAAEFEGLVQVFTGGPVPEDLASQLMGLGVSHVWLSGFTEDELLVVANADGLTSAPDGDEATVFTVVGLVSRALVLVPGQEPQPVVDGVVPAGGDDRLLRISEAGVTARVAGHTLEPAEEPGTFRLGELSGTLDFRPAPSAFGPWLSLVIFALLALFAMPSLGQADGARRAGSR